MDSFEIFQKFLAILTLFLAVFGTISNTIVTLVICIRKNLRLTPTFVFIAFNCTIETIPLYFRNLTAFTFFMYGYLLEDTNDAFCTIHVMFHMFTIQASAWLLVAMSVERLLSIIIKTWRTRWFNSKKAAIVSAAITALFLCCNVWIPFQSLRTKVPIAVNKTRTACVGRATGAHLWIEANTYIYSLIPFVILFIVNGLLIYYTVLRKSNISRSIQDKQKRKSLTASVIAITASFIILTAPSAIANGYFIWPLSTSIVGVNVLMALSTLRFMYHSFNIIVLVLFNKKFASELKATFVKRNAISDSNTPY